MFSPVDGVSIPRLFKKVIHHRRFLSLDFNRDKLCRRISADQTNHKRSSALFYETGNDNPKQVPHTGHGSRFFFTIVI